MSQYGHFYNIYKVTSNMWEKIIYCSEKTFKHRSAWNAHFQKLFFNINFVYGSIRKTQGNNIFLFASF